VRLAGYGTALSTILEKNPVLVEIAKETGRTPMQVAVRWTIQKGVSCNIKADLPEMQAENM